MYSIGLLSVTLFAVLSISSALQCSPVMCLIACPYGFEVNAQGCPICQCRRAPANCIEPILGYNCGSVDHRNCPASHECQLAAGGYYGQCCMKVSSTTTSGTARTTTARAVTGTSTAASTTPRATTAAPRTTTHRAFKRFFTGSAAPGTGASGSPAATTQGSLVTGPQTTNGW